jgi:hypothetical protein
VTTTEATRISFEGVARGAARVPDRVVRDRVTVVAERGGSDEAVISPAAATGHRRGRRPRTRADREAVLATAGERRASASSLTPTDPAERGARLGAARARAAASLRLRRPTTIGTSLRRREDP